MTYYSIVTLRNIMQSKLGDTLSLLTPNAYYSLENLSHDMHVIMIIKAVTITLLMTTPLGPQKILRFLLLCPIIRNTSHIIIIYKE